MSKNVFYEDVKIIKKPVKKRLKSFLIFFVIIVVFALTIIASIGLSNAITVGNISSYLIFGDTKFTIGASEMYAITLGSYDNLSDAEKVAYGSMVQGASGYVWESDKFYVIGNIYKTLKDAESVKENLKDSNYNTSVLTISIPKIQVVFTDLENKDVSDVKKCIMFIDEIYESLYSYSISFDKSEINNFAVSSNISTLRGECKGYISNIQRLIQISQSDELKILLDTLICIDEVLNDAILKTIDNSSTNYCLKNSIAKIVRLKYELYCQL